jgi:hypothetical protein
MANIDTNTLCWKEADLILKNKTTLILQKRSLKLISQITNMLEFLIDNIFVMFGGCDFQQTVGIHGLLKTHTNEANFMFRYIDDDLSLNHSRFGDFVDRIYPIELEINDTQYTDRYASYIDLHLQIESEGRKRTKLYDK